ncbi:hypothetical protein [Bradyrhizobium amphicarpaeae]|uniref:hypothetical protein n=1 Tax=Bradyrhizobium amphicarpaeae TaxID=1404768 RepID=UPI0012D79B79|nr:hypothetical protein [Bradyrhizobium amphicarpaeae]
MQDVALRFCSATIARRTNSDIIDLICKIIMRLARHDVEILKTRLNALIVVQSKRAKPY